MEEVKKSNRVVAGGELPAWVPLQEAWPDAASMSTSLTMGAEPNLLLFELSLAGGVQP